jgi:O-antigen/teichoic acid export membrane protein
MLSYSVRSFAVNAVGALLLQSGTVIAGILLRPQDVTYYNAAFRVYSSVRQLIGWANDPFRPALSRLGVTSRDAATKALMAVSFVTLALSSSGCIALMLAAPDVVKIWLGAAAPKYVAVALTILLAGLIVNAVHLPLVPAADAAGSPGAFFIPQLSWMIMTLAGSVLLGNLLGAPGVALGLTLPLVLVEPYYLLRAGRVLQFSVASWFKLVLLPTALITTGGLLLAGLCAILMLPVQVVHMGFFQAAAFLIGVILTALTLRKKLPWENFSRLARLDL